VSRRSTLAPWLRATTPSPRPTAATFKVGSSGHAFGVASNTTMTVLDLRLATEAQAVNGLLYNGNTAKRDEANGVYSVLNQAGGIS